MSPDGRFLVVTPAGGTRMLWPVDGGEPREVRGLSAGGLVAGWATDSGSLFVSGPTSGRGRDIARVELASRRNQV